MLFTDMSNAFCQADKLQRKGGRLFASPCEGLGLHPEQLIELNVPVYGLVDAPAKWRRTLCTFLWNESFRPTLLKPCYWVLRSEKSKTVDGKTFFPLEGHVLIEVDDLLAGVVATPTPWDGTLPCGTRPSRL